MSKNQLFKILPDEIIINLLLAAFNLLNINDHRYFTKDDMKTNNTVKKIITLKPQLNRYYLPCKSKIYLYDLTEKKTITILRHFIKYSQYKLNSKEIYMNKSKIIIYQLIQKDNFEYKPLILEDNKTIFF